MRIPIAVRFQIALLIVVAVLMLGNSSGPALNQNYYTGAPTSTGGQERTCSTCHNSGSFGEPKISVSFSDGQGMTYDSLGAYMPGKTYQVTVAIGYHDIAPAAYGFQAQVIDSSAFTAGNLAAMQAGVQRIEGSLDRVFVEHSSSSVDSLFQFEWTAPASGTGPVEMYVVGNLVDRAIGNIGDNGSTYPTIIKIEEEVSVSTHDKTLELDQLYPNPARHEATLSFQVPTSGQYILTIYDNAGRMVYYHDYFLETGPQSININLNHQVAGIYTLHVNSKHLRANRRLVISR